MICPSCASEVPAGARFCPTCGHNLIVQAEERRVVTVVFGDIVGFTGLSESADPEQIKHLVDRCFERLADDVVNFGGHVDKVVGDALVALFGAPVAHEDDGERAVRAALQMQRSLREVAAELGADVQMRIGVNTGEVLVGAFRAGGDYTAMGDVVNIASRLQTLAKPGQVIVGPDTYSATSQVIRYEPLGDLETRGREAWVPAWEAVAPISQPGSRARHLGFRLIGRDAELGMLAGAVDAAFAHRRPYFSLVIGEAGVGKSRLLREVFSHAQERHNAGFILGRSLPYGQRNPWWMLADLIRSAVGLTDEGASDTRRKLVAAASAALGEPPDSQETLRTVDALLYLMGIDDSRLTDLDQARARDEVLHAVEAFLEGRANQGPLVVALGDLQWADDLVLDVLDHMLGRLPRLPIVFLASARPELMDRWKLPPGPYNEVVLHLDPLGEEASGDLLTEFLGRDPGPVVRRQLVSRAGGNPLFLEEMAAILNETGDLAPLAFGNLPATLRGLVAARLDALPQVERNVIDALAVLGRRGLIVAIQSIAGDFATAAQVREALDDLHDRDMVSITDEHVEFVSDLVREVAYNTLSKAERARRHARLALWTEDEAAKRDRGDEALEELAHHWATAAELVAEVGDVDGVPENVREIAMVALQRAAERADDRELHAVAGELFSQMVQLLGDDRSSARRHALVGRARASTALHHNARAAADLDVVEAESEAAGDDVALARALVVRGDLYRNLGDFPDSIGVLERALQLWRSIGDRRGEASALRRIGFTHLYAGRSDKAEPFIVEALEAFREIGVRRGIAWAQQNLAWVALSRGQSGVAEQRVRDSIALFQEIGDWAGESWALSLLATILSSQGQLEEAGAIAARLITEADEYGDRSLAAIMRTVQGAVRLAQGRVSAAVEQLAGSVKLWADMRDNFGLARAVTLHAHALRLAGRIDEAEDLISAAVGAISAVSDSSGMQPLQPLLVAQHAVELGQPDIALPALDTLPRSGEVDRLRGQALAQAGYPEQALSALATAGSDAPTMIATAFALLQLGRHDEAKAAIDAGRTSRNVRYLDHAMLEVCSACVSARELDDAGVLDALDRAEQQVDGTDDLLTAALVGLARAVLRDEPDARHRLAELGIPALGWESMFAAARATAAPA